MLLEQANTIIDSYSKWIAANMSAVQQGDSVKIITPMLNRNNDCMSIVIGDLPAGGYALTDLGETISDLELSGFLFNSEKRREKLNGVIAGFGISKTDDGELYVKAGDSDFLVKMNMMMQAMASVDDLFQINSDSVRALFYEEVGEWMDKHEIRAIEGPSFTGKSGMLHKFDYAIPGVKRGERKLVKTVNTPVENNVKNALFGWEDIEQSRTGSTGYIFLNAANGKDGHIDQTVLSACEIYGMKPIQWGVNQDDFIEELAA